MTDNTQYTDINRGNNDVTPEGVLVEQSEVLLDDSQRATGWLRVQPTGVVSAQLTESIVVGPSAVSSACSSAALR